MCVLHKRPHFALCRPSRGGASTAMTPNASGHEVSGPTGPASGEEGPQGDEEEGAPHLNVALQKELKRFVSRQCMGGGCGGVGEGEGWLYLSRSFVCSSAKLCVCEPPLYSLPLSITNASVARGVTPKLTRCPHLAPFL